MNDRSRSGRSKSGGRKKQGGASQRQRKSGSRPSGKRGGAPKSGAGKRGGGSRSGDQRGGEAGSGRRGPARGLGGDQVEGRQAVRELLLAGRRQVREIFVADDLDRADIVDDITELAGELGVPLRSVGRKRLAAEASTGSHQGVVARAAQLPEVELDRLTRRQDGRAPFLLIVDGVTDPGNLGAMLRTAECAGVTGVVLGRHRSVHITPTVTKAAAGAIEHLPMAVVGGIPAALSELNDAGMTTIGLDAGGESSVFDAVPGAEPVALVLGAEGRGLSRLVSERVDRVVAIPLLGGLNSLNVSAATAIACFEVVRRRTAN
ncbi:MAG: 23S rRNA (guanosine(2251)-2'-O)-methyltransferase RlmB [Acidimicrobiales bacterium]